MELWRGPSLCGTLVGLAVPRAGCDLNGDGRQNVGGGDVAHGSQPVPVKARR
jgi:hypothetical protein